MSVAALVDALIEAGIDEDELKEAVEALGEEKPKGKKGDKGGKKGGGKKKEETVEDLIADLDEEALLAAAVYMELTTAKKGAKLDEDELRELFEDEDVDAVKEAIADGDGGDDEEAEEGDSTDYDDMETDDLVKLVVKRELATKKKAEKMSDEDLIDLLEADDD